MGPVSLFLLLCCATSSPLPAESWVDLPALVRLQPEWQRVTALRDEAARLREAAAAVAPAEAPAPPAGNRFPVPPAIQVAVNGFHEQAGELEIQLLRDALSEQIARQRARRLTEASRVLFEEWLATVRGAHTAWREWERAMVDHQIFERITLELRIEEEATGSVREWAERERNALSAVTAAVAAVRLAESGQTLTRRTRQRVAATHHDLDEQAAAEQVAAETLLQQRTEDLATAAEERDRFIISRQSQTGWLAIDLALTDWRNALLARREAAVERVDLQRGDLLAAADELDAEAATTADRLAGRLEQRVRAWVKVVAAQHQVVIRPDPTAGWPESTAQVARLIAALQAEPANLAPTVEIHLP